MDLIDFRKIYSKQNRDAYLSLKEDRCFICNEKITSAINSHSVPKFVLENIAINGKIKMGMAIEPLSELYDSLTSGSEVGLNNAGTFHLLCGKCDKKLFEDYESEDALSNFNPNNRNAQKLLAAIMLKSVLREYVKKVWEKNISNSTKETAKEINDLDIHSNSDTVGDLNKSDYEREIKYCLDVLEGSIKDGFTIIYYEKLSYRNSIACQTILPINHGLDDKVINDIFDDNPNNHMDDICICSFPLKKTTTILAFVSNDGLEKYKKFIKQFKGKNRDNQLKILQAILFNSEEFYVSIPLVDEMKKDNVLQQYLMMPHINALLTGRIGETHIKDYNKIKLYLLEKFDWRRY